MSLARAAAALLCILSIGQARALPEATPEELGLSRYAIAEFLADFQRRVDRKELPGAVLLLARDGKIAAHAAVGYLDHSRRLPMRTDAIFRLSSMTKPITAAAAMALADAGKLNLGDPLSMHLPELKALRVGIGHRPALREPTVLDLLRHTAGLGYAVEPLRAGTLADMAAALGKLPLKHQPGSTWDYSIASDVLGRVIEVASGLEMDDYIRRRLTEPLGMHDTGFRVEAEKRDRLANPRVALGRPRFLSGGAGMVSTAMDYARFCQMLLDGGVFDDMQVLSKESAEAMTSDQLPANIAFADSGRHLWGGVVPGSGTKAGFGLGFGVQWRDDSDAAAPRGEFWWVGDSGTSFVVNVEKRLVAILLTQQSDQFRNYLGLLRRLARAVVVR